MNLHWSTKEYFGRFFALYRTFENDPNSKVQGKKQAQNLSTKIRRAFEAARKEQQQTRRRQQRQPAADWRKEEG